ncbi:alpha/beta hydrolase family protein [Streptomyces sp. NPDC058734]|uniref:alpha/beta hydrolase family protein n=1 Tax=Streptomyces sp. NPDC058734 TaxID=3346615 RepID=UPI0036822CDD
MKRRTLAAAVVSLLMAGTVAGTGTARAAAAVPEPPDTAMALPAPGVHRPVGRTVVHLEDAGRADPWVPGERRELMVSLWYPAVRPSGVPAPYMTGQESALYVKANKAFLDANGVVLADDAFTRVVTHATVDAEPLRVPGGLPLVVLSPGFGMHRATLTGLAEELAGRGYLVAGIGHNHESTAITFPDGHTTTCDACGKAPWPEVGAVRARDVSFVLDRLTGQDGKGPVWQDGAPVDPDRIAMVGHSAGGFSTVPAMLSDPRVKAGVNMDGGFHVLPDRPLDRPLLMLGQPGRVPGGSDGSWQKTWDAATGWKRWLTVDGTQHLSFTDLAVLTKQLGIRSFQALDGDRADAVTRAYVSAFVETHLGCRAAPLLDGPSQRYPEVRFHRP